MSIIADKFEPGEEVVCVDASEHTSLKVGEKYTIEALYTIDMHGARFYWVKDMAMPLKGSRFVSATLAGASPEPFTIDDGFVLGALHETGSIPSDYLEDAQKAAFCKTFELHKRQAEGAYLEDARRGQLGPRPIYDTGFHPTNQGHAFAAATLGSYLVHDEVGLTDAEQSGGTPIPTLLAAVDNIKHSAEVLAQGKDAVTLPEHYARFAIEPIRFICENDLNFFQGNIVKYILRHDAKNGLEDLKKAQRYLTMFIRFIEQDPDWWKA